MMKASTSPQAMEAPAALVFSGVTEGVLTIEGDATIAEGGVYRGQLTARRIIVLGSLEGVVIARESLHLGSGATLTGEARAARLTLDAGAAVEALVRAGVPGVKGQPASRIESPAVAAPSPVYAEPPARPTPPVVAPRVEEAQAISMDDVERTLTGFEVKLAQMAARTK